MLVTFQLIQPSFNSNEKRGGSGPLESTTNPIQRQSNREECGLGPGSARRQLTAVQRMQPIHHRDGYRDRLKWQVDTNGVCVYVFLEVCFNWCTLCVSYSWCRQVIITSCRRHLHDNDTVNWPKKTTPHPPLITRSPVGAFKKKAAPVYFSNIPKFKAIDWNSQSHWLNNPIGSKPVD